MHACLQDMTECPAYRRAALAVSLFRTPGSRDSNTPGTLEKRGASTVRAVGNGAVCSAAAMSVVLHYSPYRPAAPLGMDLWRSDGGLRCDGAGTQTDGLEAPNSDRCVGVRDMMQSHTRRGVVPAQWVAQNR